LVSGEIWIRHQLDGEAVEKVKILNPAARKSVEANLQELQDLLGPQDKHVFVGQENEWTLKSQFTKFVKLAA
jgi:hypothetical protein